MKRHMRILSGFCLLLLLLITACDGGERTLTDQTQPIEVEAGDEFTIVVNSNPTTGYEWRLVEDTPDGAVVEYVSKEYEPDEPIATGSGGQDIWTFRAVAAGETEVKLGHFPPDGSNEPQAINTYQVIVR